MANIEWQPIKIKLGKIIPWELNPRQSTKAQAERLIRSEKRLGQMQTLAVSPFDDQGRAHLYDGHQRYAAWFTVKGADYEILALQSNRYLTEDERKEAAVTLHTATGQWDWNSLSAWGAADLKDWGMDEATLQTWGGDYANLNGLLESEKTPTDQPSEQDQARRKLADRFGVPPFSVLDARQGYWQDRKRAWIALGIKGELGRGGLDGALKDSEEFPDPLARKSKYDSNLLGFSEAARTGYKKTKNGKKLGETFGSGSPADLGRQYQHVNGVLMNSDSWNDPAYYYKKQQKEKELGRTLTTEEFQRDYYEGPDTYMSGTSIFDPVLCELMYKWFAPVNGGAVLDPFAGGSVRGIVASLLGMSYTGVDLSDVQVRANLQQATEICGEITPRWIVGDSFNVDQLAGGEYDFLFSCPPYADLEVYSDNPLDLSTMDYPDFVSKYNQIIKKACDLLRPDRFACFVVGEVRDKNGIYRDFVGDTIKAFKAAGLKYYNEIILVTSFGSLPIRVGRQFEASRKIGKTHQNVLVFLKGDHKKAVAACGEIEMTDFSEQIKSAPPMGGADQVAG